jgi:hypothetical protein
VLAAHPDLSAAVLDFGLSDGERFALCAGLNERHVPFVLHIGNTHVRGKPTPSANELKANLSFPIFSRTTGLVCSAGQRMKG